MSTNEIDLTAMFFTQALGGDVPSLVVLSANTAAAGCDEVSTAEALAGAEAFARLAAAGDHRFGQMALALVLILSLRLGVAQGERGHTYAIEATALLESAIAAGDESALPVLVHHLDVFADSDEQASVRLNAWADRLAGADLNKLADEGKARLDAAQRGEFNIR